ncbi:ATP synthase subunit epsilon, mitochondrial-like isoform X1 [Miscanthus floridulus]|uniref:ATP synthase subunit epsilon, mitochondrial isoform X1 n=1 Tax=Miscanthus floridulus TaxID=154761 RepID=UPI003457C0F6
MSATTAAVPFWRAAGMTYIGYSNICAALVRNCLKEPFKSEAASREKVHFSISKWADGKQEKPKSSRSVRGLGKGVSGKPYPRLCNARRPRLEPGTFRSQALSAQKMNKGLVPW